MFGSDWQVSPLAHWAGQPGLAADIIGRPDRGGWERF